MKKMFATAMAAALALSLTVPAFAVSVENLDSGAQTSTQEVKASYNKTGDSAPSRVYKVEVEWTVTEGVYSATGNGYTWNPETHMYDVSTTGDKAETAPHAKVAVTNHSNDSIKLNLAYADEGSDSVTTSATFEEQTVKSAATASGEETAFGYTTGKTGAAQNVTIEGDITIDDYTQLNASAAKIGTLTLTLTPNQDALNA